MNNVGVKVMGGMAPIKDGTETQWIRRAYPIPELMKSGYVMPDNFAGKQVVAFLEPDTQTANLFVRNLPGNNLTFVAMRTDGGKVEFRDKETWSRWNIEGKCDEGPFKGRTLERIENHLSQWYGWSAYFPDTTIVGRNDPAMPGDPFAKPK